MGRFDALTHLEEEKNTNTPSPVSSSPAPKTPPAQQITKQPTEVKKPEIMISGNHDPLLPLDTSKEKPLKYSTLLDAALIKRIKLFAAEKEIKDYKVIEIALTEYFEKQRNS
jgi:hypothetical protein